METDPEKTGTEGGSYTTMFRQYDPRVGRWLSLDPLMAKFPHMSPYAAFDNNPILYTDPYGLEPTTKKEKNIDKGSSGNRGQNLTESNSSHYTFSEGQSTPGPASELLRNTKPTESSELKSEQSSSLVCPWCIPIIIGFITAEEAVLIGGGIVISAAAISKGDEIAESLPSTSTRSSEDSNDDPDFWILPDHDLESKPNDNPIDIDIPEDDIPNIYIHYTNKEGYEGITSSQSILPNERLKVYLTKSILTPKEVEDLLFLGVESKVGHGDYIIMFKVDPDQQAAIKQENEYEYVYLYGTLRIRSGNMIYSGENLWR